ncbi:MAG: SDR family oxidoreductase [Nitrospirota bacterium]|nr:SDR family oxidoreductase [Nitrospirota bacterium]MDE3034345.1 SDR family oxidoreductase [Nitrospirota bacterium]MDE3118674.1 SDR family oxidoreductase [Nitrospirota bacterium]MDE3224152.1 SDR family oxidoreductase [Nitrospirota bacterium]MDE3241717.1 SDR family oxidoreductase [Nitrospirota bacterium]
MSLEGKVVLIAGGSGALGRTVVPAFALAGAQVITMDRHPPSGQVEGRQAMQADATDEADVQRLVADVLRRAGRIDVLINLIGGFAMGRVVETDVAAWQRMLTMNLTAAFLLSKAVLPPMLARRTGRIVHVAARAAVDPFPGAAAYVVSKAGLVALVRTLAMEVAGSGVTVHGLLPSTIDTPANRSSMPEADPATWAKPESIAQALLFLAADEAGQFNGALIPVG